MSPALEQQTLELPRGRRQLVYTAGEEQAPPLVWLHGINGPEADGDLIGALADDHRVLAPLAPGFADLDELRELHDIHDLALHYDDVLDALGIEQAALAGLSFGAMIAAEYAAHYPKRVSRLVLISPLGLWNDAYPVADLWGLPAPELPRLLYADPSRAQTTTASGDVEAIVKLVSGMTSVARFLWPIPDRGLGRRLYRITAPTLIVHGEDDALVPVRYADDFLRALPNARKVIVPDAGHLLGVEAPTATLEAARAFLSRQEVPA
jgi:pimeloyl-ACP methyl ester carboxylesterase